MKLLIPGPVATHPDVRAAMTQDWAPWDADFKALYAGLQSKVLALAEAPPATHAAIALQGCGHFAMEAAVRSVVPPGGRLLVPLTGAYGERLARLAREAGRAVTALPIVPEQPIDPALVARALAEDPGLSHVGLVYSETSSGVVHDPVAVGRVVRAAGRAMVLDAVSAFGALPMAMAAMPEVQAMAVTSNKCLEGMPGLSFIVLRHDALEHAAPAGSWSFDLRDAWQLQRGHAPGSFRFTPPAQVVAALDVAVGLLQQEGGPAARLARYTENARTLYRGMQRIGLRPCLPADRQGPIVLNVRAPADAAWSLQAFVDALKRHGFLISNFHDTPDPSFRVGCIGQAFPADMAAFVAAVDKVLDELKVRRDPPDQRAA